MSNKYTLKFTVEAGKDLDEIFSYITGNLSSPVAAVDLIDKIENESKRLISFPLSGAVPRDDTLVKKGYRMLIIDNFIAFYIVDEENKLVKIMRIVYGKRNYLKLL